MLVALGNKNNNDAEKICHELRECHARIVGAQMYASASMGNRNNWIGSISPNLSKNTTMAYIVIVDFEFLLATVGVACLIRYYNHRT